MKSLFRATAILSGSSLVSILLGLVSARILASILHPDGYGYYGLLQSFVAVASLLAGMGMATGVVRLGAATAKANDQAAMAALTGGAWLLVALLAAPILLALVLFRSQISLLALGTPDHSGVIVLMGLALLFTVSLNVQNGILNAWHRVEVLATYGIVNSVINAVTGIVAVLLWQDRGIVPAVIVSAIFGWAASRYFLHRSVNLSSFHVPLPRRIAAARTLLAFGVPFTASLMAGSGVQLAMPMVVVHLLDAEAVGYYKAAAAISVSYLGFLVAAMTQDYYPRVSAIRDQPQAIVTLINEQQRLIMLLAAPAILFTLALVPYIVPLIYSSRFMPAVDILEWQLIGDLFKFSSWTISFAILARCSPSVYFLAELTYGVLTLSTNWLAVRFFGLQGLGIGFVATSLLYFLVVWVILRHEMPLTWTSTNRRILIAALAAALVIQALPFTPLANLRTLVALILAAAFSMYSVRIFRAEYRRDMTPATTEHPAPLPVPSPPLQAGKQAEI